MEGDEDVPPWARALESRMAAMEERLLQRFDDMDTRVARVEQESKDAIVAAGNSDRRVELMESTLKEFAKDVNG